MSADNYLLISKSKFTVKDMCASTDTGRIIGTGKNLEEAIKIAEDFEREMDCWGGVEYGISFEE